MGHGDLHELLEKVEDDIFLAGYDNTSYGGTL
jgi:hypothetical protein